MNLSDFSSSQYNLLISTRSWGKEFHSLKKYMLFEETQQCLNFHLLLPCNAPISCIGKANAQSFHSYYFSMSLLTL